MKIRFKNIIFAVILAASANCFAQEEKAVNDKHDKVADEQLLAKQIQIIKKVTENNLKRSPGH